MFGKLPSSILKQAFIPPANVAREAAKGLLLRKKFRRGGTSVGVRRAVQLSRRSPVSVDTVQRMHSFFSRHAVDRRPGWSDLRKPSNGYIAWLLWGGDPGWRWAMRILKSAHKASAAARMMRSLGSTEVPPEFWDAVRADPSDESVERLKQLFSAAMQRQETRTN